MTHFWDGSCEKYFFAFSYDIGWSPSIKSARSMSKVGPRLLNSEPYETWYSQYMEMVTILKFVPVRQTHFLCLLILNAYTYNLQDRCWVFSFSLLPNQGMFPEPMFTWMISLYSNMAGFLYGHLWERKSEETFRRKDHAKRQLCPMCVCLHPCANVYTPHWVTRASLWRQDN